MDNMENTQNPQQEETVFQASQVSAETAAVPEEAAAPAETAPAEEAAAPEQTPAEAPAEIKKGLSGTSAVALAVAAVLLLAAIVAVLVMNGKKQTVPAPSGNTEISQSAQAGETAEPTEATVPADGNPDDITCKGSYTADDEAVKAAADTVVATSGSNTLTVGQLQVHYWMTVQNFLSQYGAYAPYFGLDSTQPLDTQVCSMADNRTWQQYFLDQALRSWKTYEAVRQAADEAGFQLSKEQQEELDTMDTSLEETAKKNSYASAADMISTNFGAAAVPADYKAFWDLYFRSIGYYNEVVGSFTASDEEIAEYFNAHEAEFAEKGITKDTYTVDVRHILITPESTPVDGSATGETTISEDAWTAAEEKAQALLDRYLSGEKTEDSFAVLANENSQDPGSNTGGGLYSGVTQGQMVEAFDSWCFDGARQVGDTGIVKTNYGYHVMLFCGSQTTWQQETKNAILGEKADTFVEEALAAANASVDYSAIRLGLIKLG